MPQVPNKIVKFKSIEGKADTNNSFNSNFKRANPTSTVNGDEIKE